MCCLFAGHGLGNVLENGTSGIGKGLLGGLQGFLHVVHGLFWRGRYWLQIPNSGARNGWVDG